MDEDSLYAPLQLTSHRTPTATPNLNDMISIVPQDLAGINHRHNNYAIFLGDEEEPSCVIQFQQGFVGDKPNGLSMEALLAILIHRLEGHQVGEHANVNNAHALTDLQSAMNWLHLRTAERDGRGVLNTPAA